MTLTDQVKQLIEEKGLTQTQVAKECGFSSGALSSFFKGSYKGDNEKLEASLQSWYDAQTKQTATFVSAPDFVETPTATKIFADCDFLKMFGKMGVVYGASGVGKTQAARQYTKANNNVWMITARPSICTINEVLYEMALELGISDAPKRAGKLSRILKSKLSGTKGLMIIDEADHLPLKVLEELRILQEDSEVGFMLIGNDKVYTQMQGGFNQRHQFARLWSRNAKRQSVQQNSKKDIDAVAQAWGLELSDTKLMNALYSIGQGAGSLRALTNYLQLAGLTAKARNEPITLPLILSAQKQMG
ncbi:AAA family ATPase [Psychrobacter sp. FDAARGOS_221]|uniref:AAA family ATPase n=1 Tax=Psychrobacter sp. FDAARGOS_221 TaxID=1975705 RepID=UPI000BB53EB7|nr:AAA family ATPase [Psychrobacter sp. FDAARGOS_221]PNK59942.1 DNA transposition protein [Psychrobacter sp. FDAARGOS_221]